MLNPFRCPGIFIIEYPESGSMENRRERETASASLPLLERALTAADARFNCPPEVTASRSRAIRHRTSERRGRAPKPVGRGSARAVARDDPKAKTVSSSHGSDASPYHPRPHPQPQGGVLASWMAVFDLAKFNRPKRKLLPSLETRVLVIAKLERSVPVRSAKRDLLTESETVK
jgi:hypothetical protein